MRLFSFALAGALLLAGCTHEPPATTVAPTAGTYPAAIGRIIESRCAGCHNAANASQSGGLRLDTWNALFDGGSSGAVAVPYHLDNSVLLHYINTYPDLGTVAAPTMPISTGTPATDSILSRAEVQLFRDWIAKGAPDADGNVPFASDADTRQKIYITMQACGLVGVVDAQRRVVMRYIPVGSNAQSVPHAVRVSPDGRYAYVTLSSGGGVVKIDTRTDAVVGMADLRQYAGGGVWNVVHLSEDGKRFAVTDFTGQGGLYIVNTETMQVTDRFAGFTNPHAITSDAAFSTLYITSQNGNTVYRVTPATRDIKLVSLDGNAPNFSAGTLDPHEIQMAPDGSKYFVTCQASNDVRVVDAKTDSVLAVIPVGAYPQEFALSSGTQPYLFVTCMNDGSQNNGFLGSVYVINYQTMQVVKAIYGPFWQPHGIAVDARSGIVYVASRNASNSGIPPHHAGSCGGRNGWYSLIDLNTLNPVGTKRFEVSEEPYSADVRFKGPAVIQ